MTGTVQSRLRGPDGRDAEWRWRSRLSGGWRRDPSCRRRRRSGDQPAARGEPVPPDDAMPKAVSRSQRSGRYIGTAPDSDAGSDAASGEFWHHGVGGVEVEGRHHCWSGFASPRACLARLPVDRSLASCSACSLTTTLGVCLPMEADLALLLIDKKNPMVSRPGGRSSRRLSVDLDAPFGEDLHCAAWAGSASRLLFLVLELDVGGFLVGFDLTCLGFLEDRLQRMSVGGLVVHVFVRHEDVHHARSLLWSMGAIDVLRGSRPRRTGRRTPCSSPHEIAWL